MKRRRLRSGFYKKGFIFLLVSCALAVAGYYVHAAFFNTDWSIEDDLYGNVFPSVVISTANADRSTIVKNDTNVIGSSKSPFAIKFRNTSPNARVRIIINETEFFHKSVYEVVAEKMGQTYVAYPDIIWKYDALRANKQPKPFTLSVEIDKGFLDHSYKSRSFSMRSVNECLLGYRDHSGKYHSTSYFYAAYVDEENGMIDSILHDALQTGIVKQFVGYQFGGPARVKKEVFAIWYALQKRGFKYSSLTNTSLSSQSLFTQRVRLIDDSFKSKQLNCVDGTVLFASVLKGVGIDPVLVRVPGHMFLGFYLDKKHTKCSFLETTIIGTVDVNEAERELGEIGAHNKSLAKFNHAMDVANEKYSLCKSRFGNSSNPNYMYLELNKAMREVVQPIGR